MTDAERLREVAERIENGSADMLETVDELRSIADRLEKREARWTGRAAAYAEALGLDNREASGDVQFPCRCGCNPACGCECHKATKAREAFTKAAERLFEYRRRMGVLRGVPTDSQPWNDADDTYRAMKEAER